MPHILVPYIGWNGDPDDRDWSVKKHDAVLEDPRQHDGSLGCRMTEFMELMPEWEQPDCTIGWFALRAAMTRDQEPHK